MSTLSIHDSKVYVDGIEVDPDTEVAIAAGTVLALVNVVAQTYTQTLLDAVWPALTAKASEPVPVRIVSMPRRIHELSRDARGKAIGSVEMDA